MCCKTNKNDTKEIQQIADIWLKISIKVHRFVSPNPNEFWRKKRCLFQQELSNAEGYVYKNNEEIKGFVTFRNDNDCIYIYELFALKNKEGIGSNLIEKVKELGKSKPIVLDVYSLNISAILWYIKKGFVINEIRECIDDDLKDFVCDNDRLKYKSQRLKYRMIYLENTNGIP